MAVGTFEELVIHTGHDVECVTYGDPPVNATLECITCNVVLVEYDVPHHVVTPLPATTRLAEARRHGSAH
jgi:hypothetical protein